jgi:hypothetical protein
MYHIQMRTAIDENMRKKLSNKLCDRWLDKEV